MLAETGVRRWRVRSILFGIVFALILPSLVFCGILLNSIATSERSRSQEGAQAAALRTAETLDRELSNLTAALVALSTSPALTVGDVPAFDQQARAVALAFGHDVVLSDLEGRQLVNTRRAPMALPTVGDGDRLFTEPTPDEQHLGRMGAMGTLRRAVETQAPAVSGTFASGIDGKLSVAVMVPVLRQEVVQDVLGINLRPDYISDLLKKQNLPPGWITWVTDASSRIFARSDALPRFEGQLAGAEFRANAETDHAVWTGVSLAGEPMLAAMQRLRLADWRVGISVPMHVIEAPLRSTVMLLVITGAAALGTAGLLAWQLARLVSIPLQRLAAADGDLARGRPVDGVRSPIAEVDAVSRALVQATRNLRARADALAAERAQLAAVIETVPVGLVIAEAPSGRIIAGNSYVERLLRHPMRRSDSEADYADWVAHHPDGRVVRAEEYPLAQVLHGSPHAELQCIYQRGDGTPLWIQLAAAPILSADGTITGGVVAVLDIDEAVRAREAEARFAGSLETQVAERTAALQDANQRLRDEMAGRAAAEEQLRQSQKMEAVGQLTGGIAHDFNNLLTIVMGSLDLLRRRAQDERTCRLLDNALEGTGRAATLTSRLLAFSRRQPLNSQPVDVNSLVAGMSDLLHRTLGERIQVNTVPACGVWRTHADTNQLENTLLNLAVNARDAMLSNDGGDGRLTIETGNAVLDAEAVASDPDVIPGDYVRVAVTDTGTGMPDDVVSRVFEPFFTTKPQGQGTGLGLSQVHGFVKQSGGHVAIRTGAGLGTTVTIYLPRWDGVTPVAPDKAQPPAAMPDLGRLTILVVEDEAGVRRYSIEALRELGHVVLDAGDAAEALRLLDAYPEIGLLFTDVVLPQVNGARLAAEARHRRPGLPVLFTSGYRNDGIADADTRDNEPLPPGSLLLLKPFKLWELAEKLGEACARAPV